LSLIGEGRREGTIQGIREMMQLGRELLKDQLGQEVLMLGQTMAKIMGMMEDDAI